MASPTGNNHVIVSLLELYSTEAKQHIHGGTRTSNPYETENIGRTKAWVGEMSCVSALADHIPSQVEKCGARFLALAAA
jgi:hypothetical protein